MLTGFDLESKHANFRVFINPLISWVWIGFLVLGVRHARLSDPAGVVDRARSGKPKTQARSRGRRRHPRSRSSSASCSASRARRRRDAAERRGGEHVPAGMGMGHAGVGWAAQNRPDNDDRREGDEGADLPVRLRAAETSTIASARRRRTCAAKVDWRSSAAGYDLHDIDDGSRAGLRRRARRRSSRSTARGARDAEEQASRGCCRRSPRSAGSACSFVVGRRWVNAAGDRRGEPRRRRDRVADDEVRRQARRRARGNRLGASMISERGPDAMDLARHRCADARARLDLHPRVTTSSTSRSPVVVIVPRLLRRGRDVYEPVASRRGRGRARGRRPRCVGASARRTRRAREREEDAAQGDQGSRVRSRDGQAVEGRRRRADRRCTAPARSR